MIKTNIKMRVTPEQSVKVQEICFENGTDWTSGKGNVQLTDKPFLFIDEYEIYNNNKKWIVSLVITLFSFAGILLFFIFAILVYLYKESPIRKYKNWPLYKILFRK